MENKKWTGQINRPLRVWLKPKLTDDIYLHFSELLKGIKYYSPKIKGTILDIGAGKMPYRSLFSCDKYISLDSNLYSGIDISADITKKIPLKKESIDNVICFQVLEHIDNPKKAVDEIFRVLKKGGNCLLTTHMAAPLHGLPYDYYRFTPFALRKIFNKFSHIEIKPQGGAALSIMQLIVWGISERLPKIIAKPLILVLNIL